MKEPLTLPRCDMQAADYSDWLAADEAALDYLATRIAPKFCASTEVAAGGKTLAAQ